MTSFFKGLFMINDNSEIWEAVADQTDLLDEKKIFVLSLKSQMESFSELSEQTKIELGAFLFCSLFKKIDRQSYKKFLITEELFLLF